jgi:hypothetical protein
MVSIESMVSGNKLPAIETALIATNTVLNGSGGAGWSTQSISNIISRVTGQSTPGLPSPNVGQTVIGSKGFQFQLKQEVITGAILLIVDYALGHFKVNFPGKSIIRKYVLKPAGSGFLAGGIINILLGDPTNKGNIGSGSRTVSLYGGRIPIVSGR